MIDFSGINRCGILGRMLRLPLALIPRSAVLRVLQGKLRVYRWVAGASNHGCWLGSYEILKQKRFVTEPKVSFTVYDVGSNVGFYTLLASACVGVGGRVFAFEPLCDNISLLERHVRLNRCTNTQICPLAISDRSGKLHFERGTRRETGRLSEVGDLEVSAVSLDDFVDALGTSKPDLVKVDVEGAELQVLHGAHRLLQEHPPIIFLATHSPQLRVTCCNLLLSLGYRLEAIDGMSLDTTDEFICVPPKH
jgi:FkbM family methyltransferase